MALPLSVGQVRRRMFPHSFVSASCELQVELPAETPSERLSGAGAPLQMRAEFVFDACSEAVHLELSKYEQSAIDRAKSKAPGARAASGKSKPYSRSPASFGHLRARNRIKSLHKTPKAGLNGSA